jgi:hypothetical protein
MPENGSGNSAEHMFWPRIALAFVATLTAFTIAGTAAAERPLWAHGTEEDAADEPSPRSTGIARADIGNLGTSLIPLADEAVNTADNVATPDGLIDAVPTQYPWYELDEAAETPNQAARMPPAQPLDESFIAGPRVTSTRGEYTFVLPDTDGFALMSLDLSAPVEVEPESAVFITPHLNWVHLTDPDGADLPNDLYALSLRTEFWLKRGDDWLFQFFIEPGMYTDFDNTGSDSFRLPGQALAFYQYRPAWQIAAGVIYVDREDVTIIPAGGLIYKPNDRLRFDLIFPRPKLAVRYGFDPCFENWFYLLGEWGGSSWAVERPTGDDVVTYRDFRILLGMEQKRKDSFSWLFEAGIAMGREVEFRSDVGNYEGDPSLMGRIAIKY